MEETREIKLVNTSIQGNIITATSLTSGLRVGGRIILMISSNKKAECVIIKKVGRQIKARIKEFFVEKET